MQIIALNAQRKVEMSISASKPEDAADAALKLAAIYKYVRVSDGAYVLVFTKHAGTNKQRLAHMIANHADVVLQ